MREPSPFALSPLAWEWATLTADMAGQAAMAATLQVAHFLSPDANDRAVVECGWTTVSTTELALEAVVPGNFSHPTMRSRLA